MSKMWRSPIFEKKFFGWKWPKYAGKTGFLAFSRDFIISFIWFFAQRCVLTMLKTWPSPSFEKNFFPAENSGNRRICRFCSGFFFIFRCFFHTKTLLIAIPTIQHVSIVKITDIWSWNCLKIAGRAVFLEYVELYLIFFIKFCKLTQNDNGQNVTEPGFGKNIFPAENAGNMLEKTGFLS